MSCVSRAVTTRLERASWIRRMFEEGARLKKELGADKVFDFTLGNPEVEPPPVVQRALGRVLDGAAPGQHAYMPNAGFPAVRARLAEQLSRKTGLDYDEHHVLMTVGAGGALNTVLKALLDPGDEVILLAPYFVEYGFYVANHGGRVVLVETDEDFQLDIPAIEAALTARTKAILLNSPNNPTGVIYSAESLAALDAMLRRRAPDVVVISDEPYKALTFDGLEAPEVPACIERCVIATSWSKALAIPGERIGYLAISPRIPAARQLFDACCFTQRTLGFVNAPALWQRVVGEVGLDDTVEIGPYQEKRDLLWEGLTRMGYHCVRPSGAFYLFPRTPDPDDVAFVRRLQEEGILAVPGSGFGRGGHMRLALTVPRETIERSLPGFGKALRAGA
ncbi:MAG: pyridoxal phosphate-dependent aminotransferase [Acidobacteriota bacterium]|nr:pyridoxal phosphate-dependent aminotransferase [Acidobacteriota bacterium]MDQ7086461.1 pyridoxal phosphate-dependent aminotransferase [Acidobacteriota bacterium]